MPRHDVSFWYLANHLGRRFLAEAERLCGTIQSIADGLWRCQVFDHAIFLVSRDTVAVEWESVPLHLLCREPEAAKLQLARVLLTQPQWWAQFGPFVGVFNPDLREELERMAQESGMASLIDWQAVFKAFPSSEWFQQAIAAAGLPEAAKQMIAAGGSPELFKQAVAAGDLDQMLAKLTPEQRQAIKQRLG